MQNVVFGVSFNVERGRKILVGYSKSSKGTVCLMLLRLFFNVPFQSFSAGLSSCGRAH